MIRRHIKVEKHESGVRRLPGVYLENPSYLECPGRRDIQRLGQRHTLHAAALLSEVPHKALLVRERALPPADSGQRS